MQLKSFFNLFLSELVIERKPTKKIEKKNRKKMCAARIKSEQKNVSKTRSGDKEYKDIDREFFKSEKISFRKPTKLQRTWKNITEADREQIKIAECGAEGDCFFHVVSVALRPPSVQSNLHLKELAPTLNYTMKDIRKYMANQINSKWLENYKRSGDLSLYLEDADETLKEILTQIQTAPIITEDLISTFKNIIINGKILEDEANSDSDSDNNNEDYEGEYKAKKKEK